MKITSSADTNMDSARGTPARFKSLPQLVSGRSPMIGLSALTLSTSISPRHSSIQFHTRDCLPSSIVWGSGVVSLDGLMHSSATVSKFSLRASPQTERKYHQVSLRVPFLGPYSFSFTYVNDIDTNMGSSVHLFADDCAIFSHFKCKRLWRTPIRSQLALLLDTTTYGSLPSTNLNARSWG